MDNTNALRISVTAVLVFVLFQKLNQFLCVVWGFVQIQNKIVAPGFNYLGYALVGMLALGVLFRLYSVCIERKNVSNWEPIVLIAGIIVVIAAHTGINWATGNQLAIDASDRGPYAFDKLWNYSNTQNWIVEIVAGVIFLVKLANKKTASTA